MIRWWQSPLVIAVWSFGSCIAFALFWNSDVDAVVVLLVWGIGVLVWMWTTPRRAPAAPPAEPLSPREEHLLRAEWWLNHGCDVPALYGDDGEMACNACGLDFKRMPLAELAQRVGAIRLQRGLPIGGARV